MIALLVLAVLCCLLLACAKEQLRGRRPRDLLLFAGALLGVACNVFLPPGSGFAGPAPGGVGLTKTLFAMAMAAALLLPFHALRFIVPTDIKVAVLVGAFLGPSGTLAAMILSVAMVGVLAIFVMLRTRSTVRVIRNLQDMFMSGFFRMMVRDMPPAGPGPVPLARLPFGVAVAGGTIVYIILDQEAHVMFHLLFEPATSR